jgi:hypothetical protein
MTATRRFGFWGNALPGHHTPPDAWVGLIASALYCVRACFQEDAERAGCLWPSGHIVQPERLKAVRLTIAVLLRHLDLPALYVGHWSARGEFIPLDMATISREAGLCRRRCERAISHLKKISFVSVFPPQHYNNPIPYAGLRVVRAITPAFFEWAGLSEQLERVRAGAVCGLRAGGGQP